MKIRLATARDISDIVQLSWLMPNIALGTNKELLKDLLKKLMKRDIVCAVDEDESKVIGMIFFVKDSSLDNLISPKMVLKFLLGCYGLPRLRNFWAYFNMGKIRKLIEDSYHGFMVAVEPEYRKKDIATSLWLAASGKMKGKVTLLIDSDNRVSIHFAEKRIGAKKVKEVPELFEKGKTWFLYVKMV